MASYRDTVLERSCLRATPSLACLLGPRGSEETKNGVYPD
jgi:hypothetical protein